MFGQQNNHQKVSKLMHRLGGVYREPSRVMNDTTSLLNSASGAHLRPDINDLLLNDGSMMRSLRLSGTIQMIYRGSAYHIPIDLHLPPNYAVRPPIIFVRPVPSMMIKQGHKHVGNDGMVYMPYLHSWKPRTHNLIDAVTAMGQIFGQDPPVFARPAGSESSSHHNSSINGSTMNGNGSAAAAVYSVAVQPPPPQYDTVTQEQERLRQLENEANEANEAVRIAREAERQEMEDERLFNETKQKINDKSKSILETYCQSSTQEILCHLEEKILLGKSATFVSGTKGAGISSGGGQIAYLARKRKEELEIHHEELDSSSIEQIETFIQEAEKTKKSAKEMDVDELAVPADMQSAQMLVLSAENAAIHDALYFLDKALSDNKMIALDVHLKTVRRLARRQFLIKAHLLKIGQVKASDMARRTSW